MANLWDQAKAFVPGVQQMLQNVGYNRQQSGESSGWVPRALGGSGFVSPAFGVGQAYASDYAAPSPVGPGPAGQNTATQDAAARAIASAAGGGGGGGGGGGAGGGGDTSRDAFNQQKAKGAYAGWNDTEAYGDFMATGGQQVNGPEVDQKAIDDAYATIMNAYTDQENLARTGAATSTDAINTQYGSDVEKAQAELQKLLGGIQGNQNQFNDSVNQALSQNAADFAALDQRANVRYGGGSSLGGLMKELAAKELIKQQGIARKERAAGEAKFAGLNAEANQFMSQKFTDLETYKKKALGEIELNLTARLAEISAMRGQSELDKTNAKLGLLQEARNMATQIQQTDKEMRNGLISAYISQLQDIQQRVLSPQEIQGIFSKFANIKFGEGDTVAGGQQYNYGATNKDDELAQLNAVMPKA